MSLRSSVHNKYKESKNAAIDSTAAEELARLQLSLTAKVCKWERVWVDQGKARVRRWQKTGEEVQDFPEMVVENGDDDDARSQGLAHHNEDERMQDEVIRKEQEQRERIERGEEDDAAASSTPQLCKAATGSEPSDLGSAPTVLL